MSDEIPVEEVVPLVLLTLLVIVGGATNGLYTGLDRRPPEALPWLQQIAVWLAVWAWFSSYARRHRMALIVDLGWWFFGLWIVLVPYYLFKTQGVRALVPMGAYVALILAAWCVGLLLRAAVSLH